MSDGRHEESAFTRRGMLQRSALGLGALGLGTLLSDQGGYAAELAASAPSGDALAPKPPHFPGKAKRVIHFFLNGGPSQVDTFDPKPALLKYAGQPAPESLTTERKTGAWMEMWNPIYRGRTIMLVIYNLFQTIGYYGFSSWVQTFLVSQGIEVTKSLVYVFIIAIAAPIGRFRSSASSSPLPRTSPRPCRAEIRCNSLTRNNPASVVDFRKSGWRTGSRTASPAAHISGLPLNVPTCS